MASLAVKFGGLDLKNPIIVASAPPTETVAHISRCAEAGAGAVVTKTIANYDESRFPLGARRTYLDKSGLWALSTFRRETLTVDAGVELVSKSVRAVDIPVIASVGGLDMDPASWLTTCQAVQDAGASMIQLDLFYLPHPRCSPASIANLMRLIHHLMLHLRIPIAPKLNIEIPAHFAAEVFAGIPLAGAFVMDSLRVPVPVDLKQQMRPRTEFVENAGECSLFGPWQKPITLQYTRTLAERLPLDLCAGGGFMTGLDAAEAIMFGATTVQYATAIIQRGFHWIGTIVDRLDAFMDQAGYADMSQLRGVALRNLELNERHIRFDDVKAVADPDICIMCGRCTTQVFCSDIVVANSRIEVLPHCDGCGLCVAVCPTTPKALTLLPTSEALVKARGTQDQ